MVILIVFLCYFFVSFFKYFLRTSSVHLGSVKRLMTFIYIVLGELKQIISFFV